jgi:putative nucleotidyltransferase with HDIG domain
MSDIPSREEALAIVHEFTTNENLRKHMYAVEAAMRAYARKYGEDEDRWGITGLLHDFDYERWPNQERHPTQGHPSAGSAVLEEWGVPEDVRRAILSHAEYTGVEPETRMERSLRAVDELTGFLVACSLVRPHGITDLEPKSVKKKMKDRSFAAAVDRDAMREAAEAIGEEMSDHIRFVIGAMREIAGKLRLEGKPA